MKSEKMLSNAGRQLAVEGTHRKWQDKHENIHEDHRTHSRKQKKQKNKTQEHTQKTARGDRNNHLGSKRAADFFGINSFL